ncbi:MAG: hypothetical protein KTR28_08310 [Micavibrio sp.]|nr:hypothetical protein [Micavibrio sp.]
MKTFATTLCIVGAALALSACGSTDHSGASYAKSRTAGEVEGAAAPVSSGEQVFTQTQMK